MFSVDTVIVNTLAEFKALNIRPNMVVAKGKDNIADGWGGEFYWYPGDATAADDDWVVECTRGEAGRYRRVDPRTDQTGITLTSLAALKAMVGRPPSVITQYRATAGDGGGGTWVWRSGNQSANVTADAQSGVWAAPDSDNTGASGAWQRVYDGDLHARWFGVNLDGTDDTTAFQDFLDAANSFGRAAIIPEGTVAISSVSLTLARDLTVSCRATIKNSLGASATTNLLSIDGDSNAYSLFWRGGRFDGNSGGYSTLVVTDCDKAHIQIDEGFGLLGNASSPGTQSNIYIDGCNDVLLNPGHLYGGDQGTATVQGSVPRCVSLSNNTKATVLGGLFTDNWGCFVFAGNQAVTVVGTVIDGAGDNGFYNVETVNDRYSDGSITAIGCHINDVNEPIVHAAGGKMLFSGGAIEAIPNAIGIQNCGELHLDGVRIIATGGAGNVAKTRTSSTSSEAFIMRNCYVEAEVANQMFDFTVGTLEYLELENNTFKWTHNSAYTPSVNILQWTTGTRFEINSNRWEFYDATANIANGNWNLTVPTVTELSSFRNNRIVNRTGNAAAIFRANAARQQLVSFDDLLSVPNIQAETALNYGNLASAEPRMVFGLQAPSTGYWQAGSQIINLAPSFGIMGWRCTVAGSPGTWVPFGGSWRTIAASAVAVARNSVNAAGDATETAAATVTIPGNTLGPNGIFRCEASWSYTNSANAKSLRIRWGGISGGRIREDSPTTTASLRQIASMANANATNSQKAAFAYDASSQGWDPSTGSLTANTLDTTANQDIVFTTAWAGAVASETITLERYHVEVLYGA